METNLKHLRDKLVVANRLLEALGTTNNVGRGHQSVLLSDRKRLLMPGHVHERGGGLAQMKAKDMVIIDLAGKLLEGDSEPMQEYPIHTWVYKLRPHVGSVVHIHPFFAGALAVANVPILPISKDSCLFAEGVPIFDRLPLFIGDDVIGRAAAEALGKCKALLHKGHGAIVVGGSIEHATVTAMLLERCAREQWHALAVGKPVPYAELDARRYLDLKEHHLDEVFKILAARLVPLPQAPGPQIGTRRRPSPPKPATGRRRRKAPRRP